MLSSSLISIQIEWSKFFLLIELLWIATINYFCLNQTEPISLMWDPYSPIDFDTKQFMCENFEVFQFFCIFFRNFDHFLHSTFQRTFFENFASNIFLDQTNTKIAIKEVAIFWLNYFSKLIKFVKNCLLYNYGWFCIKVTTLFPSIESLSHRTLWKCNKVECFNIKSSTYIKWWLTPLSMVCAVPKVAQGWCGFYCCAWSILSFY